MSAASGVSRRPEAIKARNHGGYVFGSAALVVFILQIVTGIMLALTYVPSAAEACSLQALNHEVTLGWFIRALHGWGSNFMVAIVLIHMGPLFVAETIGMGIIVFAVGYFLSTPRLAPLVPWLVGGLIGLGIVLLGTSTGGSLNPARQFGPAVISGHTDKLWVYLLAPMVGAEIAARLLQAFQKRRVLTHRLCGTEVDGSPLQDRSGKAGRIVKLAA